MSPEKLSPGEQARVARNARFAERGLLAAPPAAPVETRPYAAQEASRRERKFLDNLATARDELNWIKANEAWTALGFAEFADWWEARVAPIYLALSMRPTREIANDVLDRVLDDEAEKSAEERRSTTKVAQLAGVDRKTVQRRVQDRQSATLSHSEIDHKHCEACGTALDVGTIRAAQYRCTTCDPDRIHAGRDYGKPCEPCLAAELETAAYVGESETSAAGPAANPEGDSPVLGEPVGVDEQASTGTQTAAEGADTTEADGAQTVRAVPEHAFLSGEAPAPDGDGHASSSGVTPEDLAEEEAVEPPADLPAAATTVSLDGDGDPMPEQSQQPGQDSPPVLGSEGFPGRAETDHHRAGVSGGGHAPALPGVVELETLEDGDLPAVTSPSSSDPAADLMTAFGVLVLFLDNADLDAIGPLLLREDMETLHSHVEAISAYVGKLGRSRFAEMLHTQ